MDMSTITGGLAAFSSMRQLIGAIVDVRDAQKLAELKSELLSRLVEAQQAALLLQTERATLLEENYSLKKRCVTLEDKAKERGDYVLHEIRPGAFAYRYDGIVDQENPAHNLCQPCYDKGVKSVLMSGSAAGLGHYVRCTICQVKIVTRARS